MPSSCGKRIDSCKRPCTLSKMPIAQHSRELPSIGCLFPDMSEPGSGVKFLSAARVTFVEAVCSDFHRSVSRDRDNSDALLIQRSAIFRVLRAAFLKDVHVPVTKREARGVEKLEIGAKAATELGNVAGVVGIEELSIGGQYLITQRISRHA